MQRAVLCTVRVLHSSAEQRRSLHLDSIIPRPKLQYAGVASLCDACMRSESSWVHFAETQARFQLVLHEKCQHMLSVVHVQCERSDGQ